MKEKEDIEILQIKMILLGNQAVGKTSIINRYVRDTFCSNVMTSSNMTYTEKILIIKDQKVQLNIWDTVGQEKFRALSKLFFKDTKIVALVYSITDRHTFDDLKYWLKSFKETIGEEVTIGVMGNKSDLFLKEEVRESDARELAKQKGFEFALTSAKDPLIFCEFLEKLVKKYLGEEVDDDDDKGKKKKDKLNLDKAKQKTKKNCC